MADDPAPTTADSAKAADENESLLAVDTAIDDDDVPPAQQKVMDAASVDEQSIGDLFSEYPCVHQRANGVLKAGTKGVLFEGYWFWRLQQCYIPWQNVQAVHKINPNNPNVKSGIGILVDENNQVYLFGEMQNADRVWETLVSLHNNALTDNNNNNDNNNNIPRRRSSIISTPPRASTMIRSNSLPEMTAPINKSSLATIMDDEEEGDEQVELELIDDEHDDDQVTDALMKRLSSLIQYSYSSSTSSKRMSKRMSVGPVSIPAASVSVVDDNEAWEQLLQKQEALPERAVEKYKLPCTLDAFFYSIVADDAPKSIPNFMEESEGDSIVIVEPWVKQQLDGSSSYTRTFEYNHPVNAPMAPPVARARKEQRYRRFGEHGLLLESDCYVDDVPMADCFYVTERMLVEAAVADDDDDDTDDDEGEAIVVVHVTVDFEIRFVKSTWFRSIIEGRTRSECMEVFKHMMEFMSKVFQVEEEEEEEEEEEVVEEKVQAETKDEAAAEEAGVKMVETLTLPPPPTSPSPSSTTPAVMMQILLLLVVASLLLQVRLLHRMNEMNEQMLQLGQQQSQQICVLPASSEAESKDDESP